MNIFVLDADPAVAATLLCDQHIGKMLLEACQLLCNCHDAAPYKRTHYNHPCSVWARASGQNYLWLHQYADALTKEWLHRFDKTHACEDVVQWLGANWPSNCHTGRPIRTPFAQAMPEQYRGPDAVAAYRRYYAAEKRVLRGKPATWTRRPRPDWFDA